MLHSRRLLCLSKGVGWRPTFLPANSLNRNVQLASSSLCIRHTASAKPHFPKPIARGCISGRRYASTLSDDPRAWPLSGSILAQAANNTTIDQLIEAIDTSTSLPPDIVGASHEPLLTLLVTPSFARSTALQDLPLRVLKSLGGSAWAPHTTINTLVAVVDRLPKSTSGGGGSEGLAYHFSPCPAHNLDLSRMPLQPTAQKPGSITFELRTGPSTTSIQLPLAHTVFTTGLPSTLIFAQYTMDAASGELGRTAEKYLESQTIPSQDLNDAADIIYDVPLVPLTPARPVASSMGNIVRKVLSCTWQDAFHGGGNALSTAAASQELEAAISGYFEALNMRPEPVQVWALIVPRLDAREGSLISGVRELLALDMAAIEALWRSTSARPELQSTMQASTSQAIFTLVQKGGRLCKVLSGGGGWGKKAGLVSIDPDLEYSTRELRGDSGWDFSFADDDSSAAAMKQQREALGEMVNEGDSIMFLLAPQGETDLATKASVGLSEEGTAETARISQKLILGAVPSRIDEVAHSAQHGAGAATQQSRVTHCPGVFGMLSEGGMAISRTTQDSESPQEVRSKLDAPFGLLRASLMQK